MKSFVAAALIPLALAAPAVVRDTEAKAPSGFTLISARSGSPIHLQPIVANGEGIWIGKSSSAYCPHPPVPDCSSLTNATVFNCANSAGKSTGCGMNVVVPGGQALFVNKNGALGYTAPHSASEPEGSFSTGFTYTKATSTGSFGSFSFSGDKSTGLMACSQNKACNTTTGANCAPWKVVAALPGVSTARCLGFDALATASNESAWEYS